MSDESTHRITGYLTRPRTAENGPESFEPGDELTPTDHELEAFDYMLEPLEDVDDEDEDEDAEFVEEADADGTPGIEETAVTSEESTPDDEDEESDSDDSDDDSGDDSGQNDLPFSEDEIRDADYPRLRSMASDIDEVDGRGGEDEIRDALLEQAGADEGA